MGMHVRELSGLVHRLSILPPCMRACLRTIGSQIRWLTTQNCRGAMRRINRWFPSRLTQGTPRWDLPTAVTALLKWLTFWATSSERSTCGYMGKLAAPDALKVGRHDLGIHPRQPGLNGGHRRGQEIPGSRPAGALHGALLPLPAGLGSACLYGVAALLHA